MPRGKARFNKPETLTKKISRKAPIARTPISPSFKSKIRDLLSLLKPIKKTDTLKSDELDLLVEEVVSEADWAWGQTEELKQRLSIADTRAEYEKTSRTLNISVACLRKMSWDVNISLGSDFDPQGLADECEALARRMDEAISRFNSVMRPIGSTAEKPKKPKNDVERNRIAQELAIRITQAVASSHQKVTASEASPLVKLLKYVGDNVGLARSLPSWRDTVHKHGMPDR